MAPDDTVARVSLPDGRRRTQHAVQNRSSSVCCRTAWLSVSRIALGRPSLMAAVLIV